MLKRYVPAHNQNRMGHEGDLVGARAYYQKQNNQNLQFLLQGRFEWMNSYIKSGDKGIELGAGIGASKDFIKCEDFKLTDFNESEWLDITNVDALNTGFPPETFDFLIASNLIHHLAKPAIFFNECSRILKPDGLLLIQEINTSFIMRLILRIMRHEGYDENVDAFDPNVTCNNPTDPWSANCSIPKILFSNHKRFNQQFAEFEIVRDLKTEFLIFLNSGGVIAKTRYIPMRRIALRATKKVDDYLIRMSEDLFPLQRQIVLRKRK